MGIRPKLLGKLMIIVALWPSFVCGANSPTPAAASWALTLEAVTDIPVSLGVRATLTAKPGIRLSAGLGYFPGAYLDLINSVVIPFTDDYGYSEEDGKVVRDTLENSLVARLHAGWDFTENLYGEIGYGYVGLGGGLTGQDVLILITDYDQADLTRGGRFQTSTYDVESTLHMLDLEIGWQWRQWHPWVVRTALGVAWTVASNTRIAPTNQAWSERLKPLTDYGEAYLDELYTTYVITPTVSLGVGYVF